MKFNVLNFGNRIINCWSYPIENGYAIIDTGYENNYKNFKKKLIKNNIAIDKIKYCFLTHCHDDHAGFLNQLLTENKNVKVIMSNKGMYTLRKGQNSFEGGCTSKLAFVFCNSMRLMGKGQHKFPHIRNDFEKRIVTVNKENQTQIENILGGKIIETAGHTSDSISLLLDNGCLFCGDAAMNGFPSKHKITIWAEDKTEFLQSWQKIILLQPVVIFPGHGKPFNVSELKRNIKFVKNLKLYMLKH